MAPGIPKEIMLQSLAHLLQDSGDLILDGTSTLTLFTSTLQILTQIFEQHLLPRNQNHGFIALSSHPAETSAILQAQFLFDVLQKTLSLKLVHVPDYALPIDVKIFPFKSLRRLELKCVPLHYLRGLRCVYSQLEALTCSKCVNSLKEIISACGGDLSSALPWLELQTVNFSYNSIVTLDDSLQLLNALKALDLSHNLIQDCECYLTVLTELEYLNVAYNLLPKMPELGLHSQTKLVTLILRYNQLDSINGVEKLPSLQHLDVAYNLLLEHTALAPLSLLHNLRRLHLEGNPLGFHQNHRHATICHLSPRAVSSNFLLDEEPLSAFELRHLSKLDQAAVQSLCTPVSERVQTDRSALESSCAADQSDSQSPSESKPPRIPPRKRNKGQVKVRRASISDPSDTEHEYRSLPVSAGIVRQHQAEMERMDSFRDRFGTRWLQYRRHLEADGQAAAITPSGSPIVEYLGSSGEASLQSKNSVEQQKVPEATEEKKPELPVSEILAEGPQAVVETEKIPVKEDKGQEEKPEVELYQPVLVSQIEDGCDPEPDWIFLRITSRHIMEVELRKAKVLHKLELKSLRKVETSEMHWRRMDLEQVFPVLTLHFSYIRKDRRKRRYVVLDDHPELCVQDLLRVLGPTLEENQKKAEGGSKLQCLKCKQEFAGSLSFGRQNPGSTIDMSAFSEQDATALSEPTICPSCSSDHVVILPCEGRSSTPLLPQDCLGESQQEAESGQFYLGEETTSETGTGSSNQIQDLSSDQGSAAHSSSRSSEGADGSGSKSGLSSRGRYSFLSHTDTNGGGLLGSYQYGPSRGPTPPQLSLSSEQEEHWNLSPPTHSIMGMQDFSSVDHRLKLYLDMEVFDKAEEFKCFLKVAVVKNGRPGEFLALLVASDTHFHMLEITGRIRGQPCAWLKKGDSHCLSDLSCLEVGLCHQSLHMEFAKPCTSYNLLLRNQNHCRRFLQCLTYLTQELPAKIRRKIPDVTVEEMNPEHPLWPLIEKDLMREAAHGSARPFFYLLAYLIQGASAFPVTVLSTHSKIFLVEEDYQWQNIPPSAASETGTEKQAKKCSRLKGSEPISSICGVILYRFSPCDMKLQLYDEVLKVESTWHLRTECPDLLADLVEWLRVPWEEMFSITLQKTVLEVLD